jgi:hypothetical protein
LQFRTFLSTNVLCRVNFCSAILCNWREDLEDGKYVRKWFVRKWFCFDLFCLKMRWVCSTIPLKLKEILHGLRVCPHKVDFLICRIFWIFELTVFEQIVLSARKQVKLLLWVTWNWVNVFARLWICVSRSRKSTWQYLSVSLCSTFKTNNSCWECWECWKVVKSRHWYKH